MTTVIDEYYCYICKKIYSPFEKSRPSIFSLCSLVVSKFNPLLLLKQQIQQYKIRENCQQMVKFFSLHLSLKLSK